MKSAFTRLRMDREIVRGREEACFHKLNKFAASVLAVAMFAFCARRGERAEFLQFPNRGLAFRGRGADIAPALFSR